MENKTYVMTAKQAANAFPIDKELYARLRALQDEGFEPYIDDEHPDLPDDMEFVRQRSIFSDIFKRLRTKLDVVLKGRRGKVLHQ